MSLSVLQPSQQKLAEKLTILNDRVVGMVTRLYNIKQFFWYVSGSVRREWFIWMNPTSPPLGLFILDRQVKAIEECVDDLELFHFEGGKEVGARVEPVFS
ncbi:unnamed protein product [Rangifer tarandus platyrhynchus]|uniref:Uncharacterized protein n=1 Tax=Rangifer tarandus platyrhynchus TaxID=3082113 RepID=A0ABN8XNT0_RANTA|nr:unnamed protein product [Rangifer tarandus platyrhynchus]